MSLLDQLNESQRAAVTYNEGPHLVIAGAGSGKTRVLTYKIAYLLQQGISPSYILALTFTNKAAREMRDRIARLVDRESARYLNMGTFHSIFARILRQEAQLIGYTAEYTIYDTTDSKSLLKQIGKDLGLDEKIYKTGVMLGRISEAKNALISPRQYLSDPDIQTTDKISRLYRMGEVYQIYQSRLKAANAMDFDDLLVNMNRLLEEHPEAREKYQDIFRYILVDEYQDTNYAQYRIIHALAEKWKNICVVGDDAQSIYSFRGADIRNILQFQQEYQGSPVFKLERNYRSTQNIVNAANSLIRHNRRQIEKNVYSENGVGLPLQLSEHGNDRDEAAFLAKKAELIHGVQRRSYEDMAVLYRTNAQSRVIEDELRKRGIPYRIYGGLSFYQRKEIKDVLSYFRLVSNPLDNEALLRIINFPARQIGDTSIKRLSEAAHQRGVSFFEVCCHPDDYGVVGQPSAKKRLQQFAALIIRMQDEIDRMDAYSFAQFVMKEASLRNALSLEASTEKSQEGIDRLQNVDELINAIHEYTERERQGGNDTPNIRDFLAEVALLTDQDTRQIDEMSRITLMTIHAAKGLEYGIVFIAGLEANLFPSAFCQTEREMEEERRLFYVAITRAKDECYITAAKQRFRNGQLTAQSPSPFLRDLDPRFVERAQEQVRTSWTSHEQQQRYGWGNDSDSSSYGSRSNSDRYGNHSDSRPSRDSYSSDIDTFAPARPSRPAPRPENLRPTTGMQPKGEKTTFESPYPIGSRVRHNTFGVGTVREAYRENDNDKLIIDFDTAGRKTMMLKFAKFTRLD